MTFKNGFSKSYWPRRKIDINTQFWLFHVGMEIVEIGLCDKFGMVVSLFGKWEIEMETNFLNHSKRELMQYKLGGFLAPE